MRGGGWVPRGGIFFEKKNPLIFGIITFLDSLMLPGKDGRHFKIDRTRIFSSWGEGMVGGQGWGDPPEKNILSFFVFRRF